MLKLKPTKFVVPNLDEIIITITFFQVLIVCWISLDLQDLVNHLLVILITLALIRRKQFFLSPLFGIILTFVGYQVLNYVFLGGDSYFVLRNWYRTFKSILLIVYYMELLKNKFVFIESFLFRHLKLFNFYALVNVPILLSQISHNFNTTSFDALVGTISYKNAEYYSKDLMSGLFGLFGTPRLAVFMSFLVVFNYVVNRLYSQNKSLLFDVYNGLLLFFYIWVATQNDNKGFFIIIALFSLVTYMVLTNIKLRSNYQIPLNKKGQNLFFRLGFFFLLIVLIFIVAFNFSELFESVFNEALLKIKDGFLSSNSNHVTGGGERFAMIFFALNSIDTALFGYGLGNYLYTSGNLGFKHFGQADIGTFICLGGIVHIFLLYLIIYFSFKTSNTSSFISKVMIVLFFTLSIYTHVLMDTGITIPLLWFYVIIYSTQTHLYKCIKD